MNHALRIQHSLSKPHVERLIVFLGLDGGGGSRAARRETLSRGAGDARTGGGVRGAVASRVAQSLLHHCRPSPSDVHDPDRTRVHGRDSKGNPRTYYAAYTEAQRGKAKRRGHRSGGPGVGLRSPQKWDSERVPDYMGLWCDRLLLGDHQRPVRCGMLELRVPFELEGEAVRRVAQSHRRHLSRAEVLLVTACADLPFGVLRQDRVDFGDDSDGGDEGCRSCDVGAQTAGFMTLQQALRLFPPAPVKAESGPAAGPSCASLLIGVGDDAAPGEPFTAEEERRLQQCLLPLATFGCALWAANPTRSASYLEEQTPSPTHLSPANSNLRLWSSMQAAMLSTRDAALLRAHFNRELLDARLSSQQQHYLAETLLSRLEESDRYPATP